MNQTLLATGTGGSPPFTWSAPGGSATPQVPPTTASIVYPAPGTYLPRVTDSNGAFDDCPAVQVCVGNRGAACQSATNACGQVENGTVQCDGSCHNAGGVPVQTPPPAGCPAPSCTVTPDTALPLQTVQASAVGGLKPYTWSSTDSSSTGQGDSFQFVYTTPGPKTVTVRGFNNAQSTCSVAILAPFETTGMIQTEQDSPGHIEYDTLYEIVAKVWDESGTESAWSAPFIESTVPGPWPTASFSWSPLQIFAGLPVQFQDQSVPQPMNAWVWTFSDGTTSTDVSGTATPLYSFSAEGDYTVTLAATNNAGTCSTAPVSLTSGKSLPIYREERPGSQPTQEPESRQSPNSNPVSSPGLNR